MVGWRNITKFKSMIDNIDHPEGSKMCNCRRTDTRHIMKPVRNISEECTFYRATKLYLDHYLGGVDYISFCRRWN